MFPVRYNDKFYTDVVESAFKDVVQLVFHQDVVIGAIACRVDDKPPGWKPEDIEKTAPKGAVSCSLAHLPSLR